MHIFKIPEKWPFFIGKKLEKKRKPSTRLSIFHHQYRYWYQYSCTPVSTKFSTKFGILCEEPGTLQLSRFFEN